MWPERPLNMSETERLRQGAPSRSGFAKTLAQANAATPPPIRSYEERLADLDKNEAYARRTNNKQALFNIQKAREALKKEFGRSGGKKSRKTRKSKKTARKTRRRRA
jgi:hypothetical protein